jgi:hypothetical protein
MTIEHLPEIDWNAHAALHSALEVIPLEAKVMVLWEDEKGLLRWRKNGGSIHLSGLCSAAIVHLNSVT